MKRLKLGPISDERPVKVTVELPAALYRDLIAYGEQLAQETGTAAPEPARLIPAMIGQFISADRAFAKSRSK
ncbi:DUF2274 domain-containing protein [Sandaracinobacteroides hominis]|uniref:DUF2274 domain-containing protein n=1 Tax=Sandaracinobacteroides hominis TaxID=2780086 RepID=UPI0018F743AD|nr:DUF2274 domain-containing protein [Sandaracinobacteroides hominis]